jgi:Domain of unknown function (DUF4166)
LSLYESLLGKAWAQLPEPVRALHAATPPSEFHGRCSVERGRNPLAKLVVKIIGFPAAGAEQAIKVGFERRVLSNGREAELWTRTVSGKSFSSMQFAGQGRTEALLCERFGPTTYAMALVVKDAQLHLVLRGWSFMGIPLPLWAGPKAKAYESVEGVEGERFQFYVEISHPMIGLIVRYRGHLIQAVASHTV